MTTTPAEPLTDEDLAEFTEYYATGSYPTGPTLNNILRLIATITALHSRLAEAERLIEAQRRVNIQIAEECADLRERGKLPITRYAILWAAIAAIGFGSYPLYRWLVH